MASLSNKSYLVFLLPKLFLLLVLALTAININRIFARNKVLGTAVDISSVVAQKDYYQKIVKENPTYIDGYIELANIEKFLGNSQTANDYLKIAQNLDPNRSFK